MKGYLTYIFCLLPLFIGAEEYAFQLGGNQGWDMLDSMTGVEIQTKGFPYSLVTLSSRRPVDESSDLWLTFDQPGPERFYDEMGHYSVTVGDAVLRSDEKQARYGSGAALFTGISIVPGTKTDSSGIFITPKPGALFASGSQIDDFSIDFWLYPANLEKGEQILTWSSGRKTRSGESIFQRIRCQIGSNKLEWIFSDFFTSVDDKNRITIYLKALSNILPRTWSYHQIRYNAAVGLLEYLVNGNLEAVVYTTKNQKSGGEIYTPKIGSGGVFTVGERFSGLIDNFRILPFYTEVPPDTKYTLSGGYIITKPLDMGFSDSKVLRMDADIKSSNEGSVLSQVQFFMRTTNNPYLWTQDDPTSWYPIELGMDLSNQFKGRYVQIKAQLYPSSSGESAPFINKLSILYEPDAPPPPPGLVQAVARDGAVELIWKPSPDRDLSGYVVYYGTESGIYFGTDSDLGASPLDVGPRTSIVIDGLKNGRVYYFSVAAYDKASPSHIGDLSREVVARPLRMER